MTSKPGTDVVSGVQTEALLENDPPGFRVTWIDWDSDFRRELRFNDLITGVNGRSLSPFLQPGKLSKGVGQPAEGEGERCRGGGVQPLQVVDAHEEGLGVRELSQHGVGGTVGKRAAGNRRGLRHRRDSAGFAGAGRRVPDAADTGGSRAR